MDINKIYRTHGRSELTQRIYVFNIVRESFCSALSFDIIHLTTPHVSIRLNTCISIAQQLTIIYYIYIYIYFIIYFYPVVHTKET